MYISSHSGWDTQRWLNPTVWKGEHCSLTLLVNSVDPPYDLTNLVALININRCISAEKKAMTDQIYLISSLKGFSTSLDAYINQYREWNRDIFASKRKISILSIVNIDTIDSASAGSGNEVFIKNIAISGWSNTGIYRGVSAWPLA